MTSVQTTLKTTVHVAWSDSELRATLLPSTPVPAHTEVSAQWSI